MVDSLKITAIICNYNGSAYLVQAIDSILQQTRLPDEFIIVDDKSTDNSLEIIRSFQEKHPELIIVIEQDKNQGQAAGMNSAFTASCGDILAFLDSDDVWFPNKLKAVEDAYRSCPEFGLFQHNLQIYLDSNVTDEVFMPAMTQGDAFELWTRYNTFPHFSPTSGLAVRRSVFAKLGPLPQELRISADSFLTRTAICFGPLVSTLEALGGYRRHGSNNVYGNSQHDAWRFFRKHVSPRLGEFYQRHGFSRPIQIKSQNPLVRFADSILDATMRSVLIAVKYGVLSIFRKK